MRKTTIGIGTVIQTLEGHLVCDSYNGHLVYAEEYFWNEDTQEDDIYEGVRMLTLNEIGDEMKQVDGLNHKVI